MLRHGLLVTAVVILVVIIVTAFIVNFPGGLEVDEDANEGYGVGPAETTPLGP
jgi:hypothetical protein